MPEMFICWHIIIYMTAVLICYKIRVYISFLWHNKNDNKDVMQTNDSDIVIFVPNDNVLKNSGDLTKEELNYSINKLLSIIGSTQKSLDICVYSLSLRRIVNQCLKLHKNNVRVRIITNELKIRTDNISFAYKLTNELKTHKESINSLQKAGIDIKFFRLSIGYMHNKFAIIDNRLLINGSFNWTQGGLKYNYEDVVITSQEKLVSIYSNKFQEFWNLLGSDQGSFINWGLPSTYY